jgi:hypothetical protein
MAQQLKRWESPRQSGRNEKGRGGTARQRQLKKQHKLLLKRLRQEGDRLGPDSQDSSDPAQLTPPKLSDIVSEKAKKIQRQKQKQEEKRSGACATPFLCGSIVTTSVVTLPRASTKRLCRKISLRISKENFRPPTNA